MVDSEIIPTDEHAILKEVWSSDDIETKTDLSSLQIESINKMQTLSHLFANDLLSNHLNNFMRLQKSKDRRSMSEFVQVTANTREREVQKTGGFNFNPFG